MSRKTVDFKYKFNNIKRITKKYLKYFFVETIGKKNKLEEINNNIVEKIEIFKRKDKKENVFFGYYDLKSIKDYKMLVHVIKKGAKTNRDKIELGYYDLKSKKYYKINDSKAWCWQQGSRLRWSKKDKDVIYYNDVEGTGYCTKKYDIVNRKLIKLIPFALYDISEEKGFGISINFSRLQRLRPGYGYDFLEDYTTSQKAPKNDGLFLVDLNTGKRKLLISLFELSQMVSENEECEHYLNHISISPSGESIMFFHLMNFADKWETQLCIIDRYGRNLRIIEKNECVSHYDWKDENTLLITGVNRKKNECFYREYNIKENKYYVLEDEKLKKDGHPTFFEERRNSFISDTYPNRYGKQTLFMYNMSKKSYTVIAKFYSFILLDGEKRCDMHPRLENEDVITFDSTFNKRRSIVLLKMKKGKQNGERK